MAETWKKIAFEDDAITKGLIDAKGDIIAGSADNTPAKVAVGVNGQVLTADSGEAAGVKWADASSGSTPSYVIGNGETRTLSGYQALVLPKAIFSGTGRLVLGGSSKLCLR